MQRLHVSLGGLAFRIVAWLFVWAAGMAACNGPVTPATSPTPRTPPSTPGVASTSAAGPFTLGSPSASTRTPAISSSAITLTLWMSDEIAPSTTPAGRAWRSQIDAFETLNPNIHFEVDTKKASGKGGLIDLAVSTRSIIPTRLPDLIAFDMSEAPFLFETGITQALESWLPADPGGDWFPFASQVSHTRNHWTALPFAADIDHLVYNKTTVRKAPQTWDELFKQKSLLALPLGGDDAFASQYLALLAASKDAPNLTTVDPNAGTQVLAFFKRVHDLGLAPESALSFKSVDEVWPSFAAGQSAMAQVSASRYMTERAKMTNAAYSIVPTRDGKSASPVRGWAFGVVTSDPVRQAALGKFIVWFMQGERLAPWLKTARLLPTSRGAVAMSVEPADYAGFIRDQLERAVPFPPASNWSRQSEAWRTAVLTVWNGQTTPEDGARTAAK